MDNAIPHNADGPGDTASAPKRNWWKWGFWIALLAFEVTRELMVLEGAERIRGGPFQLYGDRNYVHAEGQWVRSDGGSPLADAAVVIDCYGEWNTCIEISGNVGPFKTLYIFSDLHEIGEFSDKAVAYTNAAPTCVTYAVRLDLAQKRVIATRTRKDSANLATDGCSKYENRVSMELLSGLDAEKQFAGSVADHSIPILAVVFKIVNWLG